MITQERIVTIVGAVLAVLLQIILAPHIGLFGVVPNIIVAYTLVVAVTQPQSFGSVMPFVLGLFFDLFTGGPVGAMAFSLMVFSVLAARVFDTMNNDTLFMPLLVLGVGVLLVELSYGMFLLLFGYPAGLFEAIAYRVFPCFVYDLVIGLLLYPLAKRFLMPSGVPRTELTQLR